MKVVVIPKLRSVSYKELFLNLQSIRLLSIPSLAHFTPYFSDLSSEDGSSNSRTDAITVDQCHDREDTTSLELNSSSVVEILNSMRKEPISAWAFFGQVKGKGFQHSIESYLAIIKILCHWGFDRKLDSLFMNLINPKDEYPCFKVLELLEVMVEELKDDRPNLMHRAFNAVVKCYASLRMFNEAIDVLYRIKRYGVGHCLLSCNFLINRLVGDGKAGEAINLYKHLKEHHGLNPNVYTYGILIKAYCRTGRLKEVGEVFHEMKQAKVSPNAFTYAAYLEGCCKNGESDYGYEVLKGWQAKTFPVDAFAYTVVIQGFVSENNPSKAEVVLRDMEECGLVPDEVAYHALVQGYCDSGDVDKAHTIVKEMEAKGVKYNCLILTSILQSLCQNGRHSEAIDQFMNFKESGAFLDEVAYSAAIHALCKMGDLDEALNLFGEMKHKKLIPDVVHYTTLISGHCLQGRFDEALTLFEEMRKIGIEADDISYNVLIGGFSRSPLEAPLEAVYAFLDVMKGLGFIPNMVTHTMIIEGLCIGGRMKEAERYFNSLEEKSLETYAAMINGYCESGQATQGYEFFESLIKQGILVNNRTSFKLLSNLCLEGENDLAIKLFKCVHSLGSPNKAMFAKLISALCHAGDMKNARWAFDCMIADDLRPNVIMYTVMLNGYCQVNCLQEAFDLFNSMKNRGITPDVKTYTVLLDGYCKISLKSARSGNSAERYKKAARVVSDLLCEMEEKELKPDVVCYTALIDSQCKSDNLQHAISFFNHMMEQGLLPDTFTYTALLSGYCKQGDMDKALELVNEMLSKGIKPDSRTMTTLDQCNGKKIAVSALNT